MKKPAKTILIIGVAVVVGLGLYLAMPALAGWFSPGQPTPLPSVTSAAGGTPTADATLSPEATAAPTADVIYTPTLSPTLVPTLAPTPTPTAPLSPSTTSAPSATAVPTVHATSTPALPVTVGDPFGGGVVAYLLQPGDPGYSATVQHGIIAAVTDQSESVMWARDAFWATSVSGTLAGIRKGADNTALIIAQQGDGTDHAAGLAHAYHGGGFTDWYLPSIEELVKLFENRAAIGGFVEDSSYWSSFEGSSSSAWRFYFYGSGTQVMDDKGSYYRVRAVRSF